MTNVKKLYTRPTGTSSTTGEIPAGEEAIVEVGSTEEASSVEEPEDEDDDSDDDEE